MWSKINCAKSVFIFFFTLSGMTATAVEIDPLKSSPVDSNIKAQALLTETLRPTHNVKRIRELTAGIVQNILSTQLGQQIFETIKKYDLFIANQEDVSSISLEQMASRIAEQIEFHPSQNESLKDRSYLYYQSIVISVFSGMSPELLVRKMAHEIYQIADKINYLETSESDSELYSIIPIEDFKNSSNMCLPLLILTYESVRNTFSSARASYAEELIAEQLGLNSMPHLKVQSIERLASVRVLFDGTLSEWWPALESEYTERAKMKCKKSVDQTKMNEVLNLSLFDWLRSQRIQNGSQTLLQYLSKPQLLDHARELNRNSGPRGSVGAGDP